MQNVYNTLKDGKIGDMKVNKKLNHYYIMD